MSVYLEAWRLLDKAGFDAARTFDRCLAGGIVYTDEHCLILGEWEDGRDGRVLFIWLAIGKHSIQRFCELAPPGLQRVAFARGLRGRYETRVYSFQRLKRLCMTKSPPAATGLPPSSNA